MTEQLPLDFTASVSARTRRAKQRLDEQPTLFASFIPNIDVHLHSPEEAVVTISGQNPERVHHWLGAVCGGVRVIKSRRVAINTRSLDRLLHIRPPANVTLDANCTAVARALWADKLDLKPLKVTRNSRRLLAHSPRWPAGFNVKDVPWPAIATIMHLGLPVNIDAEAQALLNRRLAESGTVLAEAGLAGTAVHIETSRPDFIESLNLPALSYSGGPRTGRYKMPILVAGPLLNQPAIKLSSDLRAAIVKATSKPPAFKEPEGFPWTLYDFQATDAATGKRILETVGGVLLAGDMGSGKALRNDQRILTPTGWTPISNLTAGDHVIGSDGQPHTVLGVYPQGVRDLATVTFNDGTTVVCDHDHLWAVRDLTGHGRTQTLTTAELASRLHTDNGRPRWAIPIPAAHDPAGNHNTDDIYTWAANHHRSAEGRISKPFTGTPINTSDDGIAHLPAAARHAALQGLLDEGADAGTPGHAGILYWTRSHAPAALAATLARSLGGTAHTTHEDHGRYTVHIDLPADIAPFRDEWKAARYAHGARRAPQRVIVAIEAAEPAEATCIQIDAGDQLYVTENYVLTHNTTVSLALAADLDLWPCLVVAPLSAFSTWARQLGEMGKSYYLATGSPKKNWEEISNGGYDAIVMSYDRLQAFLEILEPYGFKGAIADELQRVRNPGSRRSRALRTLALSIPYRIGLSGTPLVNTAADLLSQSSYLVPGEWPPRASDKDLSDIYPGEPIESIADHLGSLMVRRRIDQAGLDLPVRNDSRVFVDLTTEQRRALAELEEEAQRAKEEGAFEGGAGKLNALTKLTRARMIVSSPRAAGIQGPNPKVEAAKKIAMEFFAQGRRGVIFATDRTSHQEMVEALQAEGIPIGVMSGATSAQERIEVENRMHRKEILCVVATTQSSAESWSCTPEGSFYIAIGLMFQYAILAQAEARVFRANSDKSISCEIVYVLARNSVDDRVIEILDGKRQLFAQIVDRTEFIDPTKVHTNLSDLMYMLTGTKDTKLTAAEEDARRVQAEAGRRKEHAKKSIYKNKGRNKNAVDNFYDDGAEALTLEEHQAIDRQLDVLLEEADLNEDGVLEVSADDLFDEDEGIDD